MYNLSFVVFLLLAVWLGYACSKVSITLNTFTQEYSEQENRIDRLINVLEDWKEKDTAK